MTKKRKRNSLYIRNFIFGVEDSLVSTVGLLSGVASTGVATDTGAVLIAVEALSMGMGSFLSEESAEEYEVQHEVRVNKPIIGALVMFVSYFVAGFIPLLPYVMYSREMAFYHSIGYSLLTLFILGFVSAKLFRVNMLKKGLQMLTLGAIAIVAGILIGQFIVRLV
jgi:VIT1/CCC1 family predicted Fe2+/Mn2+ transporter